MVDKHGDQYDVFKEDMIYAHYVNLYVKSMTDVKIAEKIEAVHPQLARGTGSAIFRRLIYGDLNNYPKKYTYSIIEMLKKA